MLSGVEGVSALLGRLEQCGVMQQTGGLLFGHYSVICSERLMQRLARLGENGAFPQLTAMTSAMGYTTLFCPLARRPDSTLQQAR